MARQLKVFRGHFGFYDTVIAAPSQKAALEAWGLSASAFADGAAAITNDVKAVEAALAKPGVVLKRPFGSNGAFKENPDPIVLPASSPRESKKSAAQKRKEKKAADEARRAEAQRELRAAKEARAEALKELEKREARLREEKREIERETNAKITALKDHVRKRDR